MAMPTLMALVQGLPGHDLTGRQVLPSTMATIRRPDCLAMRRFSRSLRGPGPAAGQAHA